VRILSLLSLLGAACTETSFTPVDPDVDDPPVEDPAEPDPVVDTDEPDEPDEPVADAPLYANTKGELFTVDPATGWTSPVGRFRLLGEPVTGMVDIAVDGEGRLFGATFDTLWRIDPTNADVSPLCEVPFAFYALTATDTGELVGAAKDELLIVDPDTCATRHLSRAAGYDTSGDIVGLPDGFLYWTVLGGRDKPDQLVRVDPRTGATKMIGPVGFDRLFGLAYADGKLFGFSSTGNIVRIDPANGRSALLGHTSDLSWWGAATNPVAWR
jgi:hypothetical protein